MLVTQDYKISINEGELRTLLCAIDSRLMLTEKFMAVRDDDYDYWKRENARAVLFLRKLRDLQPRSHGGVD